MSGVCLELFCDGVWVEGVVKQEYEMSLLMQLSVVVVRGMVFVLVVSCRGVKIILGFGRFWLFFLRVVSVFLVSLVSCLLWLVCWVILFKVDIINVKEFMVCQVQFQEMMFICRGMLVYGNWLREGLRLFIDEVGYFFWVNKCGCSCWF